MIGCRVHCRVRGLVGLVALTALLTSCMHGQQGEGTRTVFDATTLAPADTGKVLAAVETLTDDLEIFPPSSSAELEKLALGAGFSSDSSTDAGRHMAWTIRDQLGWAIVTTPGTFAPGRVVAICVAYSPRSRHPIAPSILDVLAKSYGPPELKGVNRLVFRRGQDVRGWEPSDGLSALARIRSESAAMAQMEVETKVRDEVVVGLVDGAWLSTMKTVSYIGYSPPQQSP